MSGQWGRYLWSIEHGVEKIHPDDLENFKKEANGVKVFQCVNETTDYITLEYGENSYQVKIDLFRPVSAPKYHIGQDVKVVSNNQLTDGVITDIMWHSSKNEHFYFITIAGKKKSKRYFEDEFK